MPDKLKVGIVGCGAIANIRHIPAFLKLKNQVTLQAVCDKNEELATNTARKYGVPGVYSELSQMLAKEKLDIVDICTPPQIHAPLTLEALAGGCHVVLEKPMALKTTDCDQMIAAAQKHNVKLCIVHNQLFYPPVIKARKLVAKGAIGDFIGMRIFMSDPRDEMIMRKDYWVHKLPGGIIGETGPHPVYKSLAFIGRVKNVDVQASRLLEHPWAPFDLFRIDLEGEKGFSSIVISYTSSRRASTIELLGTEGALNIDLLSMLLIRQGKNQSMKPLSLATSALGNAARIAGGVMGNGLSVLTGRGEFYGHNIIISQFVDSVRSNHQPPITAEEGRETVRVIEMIVEKLKTLGGANT
ncbi:MAG: Gfo/Idh/MocA family oxidoreductase [Chloroflexi bacterium]|nr:Gfo/Idh/MocA family oxidoreductase [Chloroflexota bacterium]